MIFSLVKKILLAVLALQVCGCSYNALGDLHLRSKTKQSSDYDVSYQSQDAELRTSSCVGLCVGSALLSKNTLSYAPSNSNIKSRNRAKTQEADRKLAKGQSLFDEALAFCETAHIFWQKGELDNALEALDEAYSLILRVDTDYHFKLAQQRDDLRFSISKRILEIYASRNIIVNGSHNAIPREINPYVQKEIDRFINGSEKDFFLEAYKKSGKYLPMITKKLRKGGIPDELAWVPMIESGFKVKAMSKARALGLWQFIPSTGYKFGLKRDQYVDERIDFVKSTNAAVAYLKELHKIFGDWATVLAAYNCGEGRVLKLIRSQNVNYLDNFWDLYERLPVETARHVPRFLAILHIVENPRLYGLDGLVRNEEIKYTSVDVHRQVGLKDIAKVIGVPVDRLKKLNPELRYLILPDRKYSLRVPPGKKDKLLKVIDQLPISSLPHTTYSYHKVKPGESLSVIAKRYCSTVKKIMEANELNTADHIVVGSKLKIPLKCSIQPQVPPRKKDNVTYIKHRVKRGDSLWIIARMYGSTTKKIQEVNGLSGTTLSIGQLLRIPAKTEGSTTPGKKYKIYDVIKGDSPFTIAKAHNMRLDRFLSINNLTPRSKIYPEQKLIVEY